MSKLELKVIQKEEIEDAMIWRFLPRKARLSTELCRFVRQFKKFVTFSSLNSGLGQRRINYDL